MLDLDPLSPVGVVASVADTSVAGSPIARREDFGAQLLELELPLPGDARAVAAGGDPTVGEGQ